MTELRGLRFPAEWEAQDAVLLAWPHAGTDWRANLAEVESTYVALTHAIARFQTAIVIAADATLRARIETRLRAAGVDMANVRLIEAEYDDTWLRDSGPITLIGESGFRLNDFRFTGWGGKFGASRDDLLISRLFEAGLFRNAEWRRIEFALEGGAIESDGQGTLLTTYICLHQRHPDLSMDELKARLADALAGQRVLMLEQGELEGDDTDAHIDTLARFSDARTLVFVACDDRADPHYPGLAAMAEELAALRDAQGHAYRLLPLPWARPIHDQQGRRLAASYANFLIINGAVLLPVYGDVADAKAVAVLQEAFPDREIVPVPARALIEQNGSLHCITMQLPKGVVHVA